jgi:hypothetical protein
MPKLKKHKKLISIQKLIHKVDRVMQDYFRSVWQAPCESCGMKAAEVCHHHQPKSRSNNLRFSEKNLVHLCNGCHFSLHKGDPFVANRYRKHRPPEWEDELLAETHIYKKFSRDELSELLLKYKV